MLPYTQALGIAESDAMVSGNYHSQGRLLARRALKKAVQQGLRRVEAGGVPSGVRCEDFDEPRTKLANFFSALLRASVGTSDRLLKHRTEAEVGNGIFEVGIQPLDGSHVRVGDVFHR